MYVCMHICNLLSGSIWFGDLCNFFIWQSCFTQSTNTFWKLKSVPGYTDLLFQSNGGLILWVLPGRGWNCPQDHVHPDLQLRVCESPWQGRAVTWGRQIFLHCLVLTTEGFKNKNIVLEDLQIFSSDSHPILAKHLHFLFNRREGVNNKERSTKIPQTTNRYVCNLK